MNAANEFDIAIVGMSGRFPGAPTLQQFWKNLSEGVESITRFTDEELLAAGVPREWIEDPRYVKAAPVLDEPGAFDAEFFRYSPAEAKSIDPQQRILLDSAERLRECNVTGFAVYRNAHDLGVIPFKVGRFGLISRHLHGSNRGPVEGVKHEDYVLLAALVTELELLTAAMACKLEVWGWIADFERLGPIRGGRSSNRDCHGRSSLRVMCYDASRVSTTREAPPFYA